MSALYFDARIDGEKLAKDIASIDAQLKSMTTNFQSEGDKWDTTIKKIGAGMAAYFSIDYLSSFAKEMVNVRGEFQKFEAVLTNTLDGDKVKASGLLEGLADFAAKTPFQLNDITENFVKLANQGIILAQEELVKLGDFAAVTGKPIGQLFEAILDINNPERWKEFGARIQTEGEKVMISFRGQKIEFDRTIEGAKNAIAQLGSMDGVAGTMSVISETLVGQISNLQDAWDQMLNNLGKANEGTFSGLLSGATSLIENYKTVLDVLKTLVFTFGAAKAAAILYNIVLKEQAAIKTMVAASNGVFNRSLAMQFLWTERAQKAQALLNKTMLTNPYVLAAAGITALVSGLIILNRKFEESLGVKRRYDEQTKVLSDGYQSRIESANELIATLKNESEAEARRVEAFEDLQRLYPSIFGSMDIHIAKTKDLATETKALAEEENKRAIIQQREYIRGLQKQKAELEAIIEDPTNTRPKGNSLLFVNEDPQAEAKLKSINDLIEQENDRLNEMIISQIDAQKQLQEESEKTIQQRIKEADSIEKLGRLREEWDKKWKTATTDDNRSKIEAELALIDSALKKMKGDGKESTWKDQLTKELEKAREEYEAYYAAIKQLGTDFDRSQFDSLRNQGEDYKEFLQNKLKEFEKNMDAQVVIAQAAEKAGINLQPQISKTIAPIKPTTVGKVEIPDTKKLADVTGFMNKMAGLAEKFRLSLKSATLDDISRATGDLSNLFGDIAYQVGEIDEQMGDVFGNLSQAFGNISNIFSGNIFQQISGATGLITQLYKLSMDTSRLEEKLAKPWEEFEKWISISNRELKRYIELRDEAIGTDRYSGTDSAINKITEKITDAQRKLLDMDLSFTVKGEGWINEAYKEIARKIEQMQKDLGGELQLVSDSEWGVGLWKQVKAIFSFDLSQLLLGQDGEFTIDRINELIDAGKITDQSVIEAINFYEDLLTQLTDAEKQKQQLLTATMASNIADSITQGFRDGYRSAADFADNFEDLMKDAIFNALKIQALEKPLQKWYEQFAAASESDNMLSASEIAQLEEKYNEIVDAALKRFDEMAKISGIDFSVGGSIQQEGLAGAIKGITEETASLIAGQFFAMRELNQKSYLTGVEQLDVLNQSVTHLAEIAANTRHNQKLVSIDKRLEDMNNYLKAVV